jgi:hypothetical protein
VEFVVVQRNDADDAGRSVGFEVENPTPTQGRIPRRANARRQMPSPTDVDSDSDDEDEDNDDGYIGNGRPVMTPSPTPTGLPAVRLPRRIRLCLHLTCSVSYDYACLWYSTHERGFCRPSTERDCYGFTERNVKGRSRRPWTDIPNYGTSAHRGRLDR